MLSQRMMNSFVGLFLLAAILGLIMLAFKVSGLISFFKPAGYEVRAAFDDIGSLKVRSPVKIGGVVVGEVSTIKLDPDSFKAVVMMHIDSHYNTIPDDSSVSILTAGLLGDNYLAINPMYNQTYLKNGSEIQDTHPAMILEKLIGQMIYKLSNPTPTTAANQPNASAPLDNTTLKPEVKNAKD